MNDLIDWVGQHGDGIASWTQALVALAVAAFTYRLFRIERQRDRQADEPLLVFEIPPDVFQVDADEWERNHAEPTDMRTVWRFNANFRTLGTGPALDIVATWHPSDAEGQPVYFRSMTQIDRLPNGSNMLPGAYHHVLFRIDDRILGQMTTAPWATPIKGPSQVGDVYLGADYLLGRLDIAYRDRARNRLRQSYAIRFQRRPVRGETRVKGQAVWTSCPTATRHPRFSSPPGSRRRDDGPRPSRHVRTHLPDLR